MIRVPNIKYFVRVKGGEGISEGLTTSPWVFYLYMDKVINKVKMGDEKDGIGFQGIRGWE